MDIVFGVPYATFLSHSRQCVMCLLDLGVKAVGCRLHARLHRYVVTRCFLCGSQWVGKKIDQLCTSDEQICLWVILTHHKHRDTFRCHSCHLKWCCSICIYLHLLLHWSCFVLVFTFIERMHSTIRLGSFGWHYLILSYYFLRMAWPFLTTSYSYQNL